MVTRGCRSPAGSWLSRGFADLTGWLATQMDKTAICRLLRFDRDSVRRIITRVMGDKPGPSQLDRLFVTGVNEVSWRSAALTGLRGPGMPGRDDNGELAVADDLAAQAGRLPRALDEPDVRPCPQ